MEPQEVHPYSQKDPFYTHDNPMIFLSSDDAQVVLLSYS